MNKSELTPLWKAANNIHLIHRQGFPVETSDKGPQAFILLMFYSQQAGCLCLYPPMKLLTNNLLNSSKELTEFGGILLNHTRAGPLRVVGKALHIISSETP